MRFLFISIVIFSNFIFLQRYNFFRIFAKKSGMRAVFLVIVLAFSLTACNMEQNIRPNSGGRTLEVLVVCSRADFDGALGDTLRATLMRPNP